jgi:hypothetical protein
MVLMIAIVCAPAPETGQLCYLWYLYPFSAFSEEARATLAVRTAHTTLSSFYQAVMARVPWQ